MSLRPDRWRGVTAVVAAIVVSWVAVTTVTDVVAASNTAAGLTESAGGFAVPTWLYLATGGGVIGVSAAFSMLVTDQETIVGFHDGSFGFQVGRVHRAASLLAGTLGVGALVFALVAGLFGPRLGSLNAAVLLTFVGVRALLTTVAYAVGNPWPLVNPWRRLVEAVPNDFIAYPPWLGSWPAVAGLLAFVWLEVVAPLTASPPTLVAVILAYSLVTIGGGVAFGPDPWFRRADPLAVWFRFYGAVAPIQRTERGLELRWPGSRLADGDVLSDRSAVAFVIALLWELTYSGFVVTPVGSVVVEGLVGIGFPPALVYLFLLLGGFAASCWLYWLAAGKTRERAETYVSRRYLAIRFAPPLLAIAAGYHFAHYAGFAVSLWPSLTATLAAPVSAVANPTVLAIPGWFGYVEIAGILLGHVLAVWVAHTVSIELFPGKLQAIRSQYPFVLVMIGFTMASLWILSMPAGQAPFTPG